MRIAESALQMASVRREESRAELSFATRTRERQLVRLPATLQPTVAPEKPTAARPRAAAHFLLLHSCALFWRRRCPFNPHELKVKEESSALPVLPYRARSGHR